MSMLSSQADKLRETADKLDRIADVSTPWIHAQLTPMLREAADTITSLRDKLQDADVAYNDAEVLGDVTQGLFRDLMAADHDTAKLWALSWPELFESAREHSMEPESVRESTRESCYGESDFSEWVCSECQCWIPLGLTPENIGQASEWRYCPHCGRKVKK